MINFRFITQLMGRLIFIESFFLLLCAFIAYFYHEPDFWAFTFSAFITALAACIMTYTVPVKEKILARRDGYFLVTVVWIIFSVFGALPYIFGGTIPSFVDAFFETMSGFTTTGSSILNDIEALPHATLFWRSLTQWLGGLGIIVLFLALLSSLGIEGKDLFLAEVPGPVLSKTTFTFSGTARRLWLLYTIMTLSETVLLMLGDMTFFDSICHSFTTMATGGFSTKQASIAHWDSAYIQYVTIFFMLLAGTNFTLLYTTLKGRGSVQLWKDNEFRTYCTVVFVATVAIMIALYVTNIGHWEKCFRDALFQVVTLVTTTGFATADYILWPSIAKVILFLLFFMGASAGSTSGGMKIVRVLLLIKNSVIQLKRTIHPYGVINVKYNQKSVHPDMVMGISSFATLYLLLFFVGTGILVLFVGDIDTAASAAITSISNVGPGFGSIGPMSNFAALPDGAKIILSILMLVGRLEVLTVLVLFSKAFWKR
ncbi:MAG: TrkH family potassium uptake protein [Marinifilaceae bacterium]